MTRPARIPQKPVPIKVSTPGPSRPTDILVPTDVPKKSAQPALTRGNTPTDKIDSPLTPPDSSDYDDYENTYDENYDQSDYNDYKPDSSEPNRPARPNVPIRYDDGSSFRENIQSPQNQQKTSIIKNHEAKNNGPSSGSHFYPDQKKNKPMYNPKNHFPPNQPASYNTHKRPTSLNRTPNNYQPVDYERAPASQNIPVLNQFNQGPTQQQFNPPVEIPTRENVPYQPNLPVYPSNPVSSKIPVEPKIPNYPHQPQIPNYPVQPQIPLQPQVPIQPQQPIGTLNYNFGSADSQSQSVPVPPQTHQNIVTNYQSNQFSTNQRVSCDQSPCFPGTNCMSTYQNPGFECGACPYGYVGNGIRCIESEFADEDYGCGEKCDEILIEQEKSIFFRKKTTDFSAKFRFLYNFQFSRIHKVCRSSRETLYSDYL